MSDTLRFSGAGLIDGFKERDWLAACDCSRMPECRKEAEGGHEALGIRNLLLDGPPDMTPLRSCGLCDRIIP